MFDARRLLDEFVGGGTRARTRPQPGQAPFGRGGIGGAGLGGAALAAGLGSLLMGSRRGRAYGGRSMARVGGMAAIGIMAYQAFQKWQAAQGMRSHAATGSAPVTPPVGSAFNPTSDADQQSLSRRLLRAMVAASKADGHIDAQEQSNIFAELDKLGVDDADKAFLVDELKKPLDVDAVAAGITKPEEAAEVYTASLLAVDLDNPAEQQYLAMLAQRLGLEPSLVQHLHKTVETETVRV